MNSLATHPHHLAVSAHSVGEITYRMNIYPHVLIVCQNKFKAFVTVIPLSLHLLISGANLHVETGQTQSRLLVPDQLLDLQI